MRASLVVIPTYNEAESITEILRALKSLDCDVLVIDDGSPDGTAKIVRELGLEVIESIKEEVEEVKSTEKVFVKENNVILKVESAGGTF